MKDDFFAQTQALFAAADFKGALEILDKQAVQEQRDGTLALFRGIALQQLGDEVAARQAYDLSINLGIKNATMAWKNLALHYVAQGKFGEAIGYLQSYREWLPEEQEALQLLGTALIEERKYTEAERVIGEWLECNPEDAEITSLMQYLQQNTKRLLESLLLLGKARQGASKPTRMALVKVLSALLTLGWYEFAAKVVSQYTDDELEGDPFVSWLLASLAFGRGDFENVLPRLHALLQSDQLLDAGRYNAAMLVLALGDLDLGWKLYHLRSRNDKLLWDQNVPKWCGEDLTGKTVLIFSEQGAGDVIQFLRFIPLLDKREVRAAFIAYDDVVGLLKAAPDAELRSDISFDEITFDYQLQLMDLALVCGVRRVADIPADAPYLFAEESKVDFWRQRFSDLPGLKVGVVWAGNPQYGNDHWRSTSLFDFAPLSVLPGVTLISLQKGEAGLESAPEGLAVYRVGDELQDFGDTAAAISALDLVLTVDTSVAHLAGALGKEVWIVLPRRGKDWRWFLASDSSPWYPSARLFTQEKAGDWEGLMRNLVRPALAERILASQSSSGGGWRELVLQGVAKGNGGQELHLDGRAISSLIDSSDLPQALVVARGLALLDKSKGLLDELRNSGGHPEAIAWAEYLIRSGEDPGLGAESLRRLYVEGVELPPAAFILLLKVEIEGGHQEVASVLLREGEKRFPDHRALLFQAGVLALKMGGRTRAVQYFSRAIESSPRFVDAYIQLYETLRSTGAVRAAVAYLERAILLAPERSDLMRYMARELSGANCGWLAGLLLEHICEFDPSDLNFLARVNHIALTGRLEEAQALMASPAAPAVEHGTPLNVRIARAYVLRSLRKWEAFREASVDLIQRDSPVKSHAFGLGWELLAQGEMKEGWKYYALGLDDDKKTSMLLWDGVEYPEASLLVYQDQGQGDMLQFCTLVRRLPRSMQITMAVPGSAKKFLGAQGFPCRIIGNDELDWQEGGFDYYIRQMKLPFLLGVDLNAPAQDYPYLRANPGLLPAWKASTRRDECLKVGIVWAGNPAYGNDTFRSTWLRDWLPLLDVHGISLYNLQKDSASNQAKGLPQFAFKNIVAECDVWETTAAAVSMLDLVISVDSGVMHLAAGLGVETWGLLPFRGTDFRWQKDRVDCPWYPSLTLFRQQQDEEWEHVMVRVAERLVATKPGLSWNR